MTSKKVDYQTLSAELETILTRLQSGELTIDEAVPAYERGMQLVQELEIYLKKAQNQVSELQAKLQD
ncbi:hypothetical protein BH09PAT3_BH09PAT3_4510 [soil metagenome]